MPNIVIHLLRVKQWLKNLMLFFPPFLGGLLFSEGMIARLILPFAAFCAASSATYIINDIYDRENDRNHPLKQRRPIASGAVSVAAARGIAGVLLIAAVVGAGTVSSRLLVLLLSYVVVSFAYSSMLKEIALVDLLCISAGFLLRLQAGAEASGVIVSGWLFLSVFLLSVFLSTGKRLAEKRFLGSAASAHRKILLNYPDGFLEGVMYMTGSTVLVTYAMYVISRQSSLLIYSVPLCCFGLLRYILRVQSNGGGDPTEALTQDIPLLVISLLWCVLTGWGVYAP